ncbi:MAG: hypothetical protein H6839_02150 [Planctomycetes bacterium]|nr:hypothetical protein [Planctomycetota bacterium]
MGEPDIERARKAFGRMVDELYKREATGRTVLAFELSEEMIAATIQSGSAEQQEAEISEVKLQLFPDAALFSARIKVKGKAWPPRPPVDTRIEFGVREIAHSEAGKSGSVLFRVEKPLTFSSTFADIVMGLLSKLMRGGPVSLDSLRHKDALVTIDFAQLLGMLRPDMAGNAAQTRLYHMKVDQARVRFELGFLK